MSGLLSGKRAYVTGGSSGIGAAIVKRVRRRRRARRDRRLVPCQGSRGDGEIAAGRRPYRGEGRPHDRKEIARAADEVIAGLGGLDIFVHSAGIDVTQTAVAHETSEETWDKMINLHLNAAFFLSKKLIPTMLKGNKPAMVFIGSVCGLVAWEGDVAYNVAKAGLQHLARCIASDYAKQGLRANVIAPGVIDTPLTRSYAAGMPGGEAEGLKTLAAMHPIGRYAEPDEIAHAAAFLASDKASFITGTVLPIDGGLVNV